MELVFIVLGVIPTIFILVYIGSSLHRSRAPRATCPICKHSVWHHSDNRWQCYAMVDSKEQDDLGYLEPSHSCECDWQRDKVRLNSLESGAPTKEMLVS